MDNQIPEQDGSFAKINIATKKNLIKNTSGFALLGEEIITELASAMEEIHVEEGQIIVKEGDLVDSVYLIAEGLASVSKQVIDDGEERATLLAVLNQGDGIGLKDTGLYSTSTRTATVIANSFCILLRIPLDKLQIILKQNPKISNIMHENLSSVLKMRLIRESMPNSQLNNERLAELTKTVTEVTFHSGEIIFIQGEFADKCYIIYEGNIEIIQKVPAGEQRATLEPGKLLGEDSFIYHGLWTATASALTPCKLLVLERAQLLELTQSTRASMGADVFMFLLTEKNHPVRSPNVIYQRRTLPEGETIITLKNPADYTYIQLNEQEWFVWLESNGHLTPSEIAHETCKKFPSLVINDALKIIQDLLDKGFVYLDTAIKPTIRKKELGPYKEESLFNWLKWVYFLKKPDRIANLIYTYGGSFLVSTPAVCCYMLLILAGFVLFSFTTPLAIQKIPALTLFPLTLIMVVSMSMCNHIVSQFYGKRRCLLSVPYCIGFVHRGELYGMFCTSCRCRGQGRSYRKV